MNKLRFASSTKPTAAEAPEPIAQDLNKLEAAAFAHPYDRSAMAAMQRLRGFDRVVGKLLEWQHERGAHVELTASSIRVTAKQLPAIHAMLRHACDKLHMEPPELYVTGGPMNAYTSGHNNPYIVLYSELVDRMSDDELLAVIGHELGHIKCSHVLYKEMVRWLAEIGFTTSRRSSLLTLALQVTLPYITRAITQWDQRSELSADRAAMLVVEDEDTCLRMLLKLAGAPARFGEHLDTAAFLEQAQRLQDLTSDSTIASNHRRRVAANSSHPLTVERARQLHRWIDEGEYDLVRSKFDIAPLSALGSPVGDRHV